MKWTRENQSELHRYAGLWVAVGAAGVYLSDETYDGLWVKLRRAKSSFPLVFQVPGFKEA